MVNLSLLINFVEFLCVVIEASFFSFALTALGQYVQYARKQSRTGRLKRDTTEQMVSQEIYDSSIKCHVQYYIKSESLTVYMCVVAQASLETAENHLFQVKHS